MKGFIRSYLNNAYSFPGCCGRTNCARDQLACTEQCNFFAIHARFCGSKNKHEFTDNEQRETAIVFQLSQRLAVLNTHFFSAGVIALPHIIAEDFGNVSTDTDQVGEVDNPEHLFQECDQNDNPVDAIFDTMLKDANQNVSFVPENATNGIPDASNHEPLQSSLPYMNLMVVPENELLPFPLLPEEGARSLVDEVPAQPSMYTDQPSFNPHFDPTVFNVDFFTGVMQFEGL